MNEKAKAALTVLDTITPDNLHLKTNASWGQRVNFESLWFNHSPQAARYSLLPYYWEGSLLIVNELSSAY